MRGVDRDADSSGYQELIAGATSEQGDPPAAPPRSAAEADYPVRGWSGGEPIPDLAKIERARWRGVLAPLGETTRRRAASTGASLEQVEAAWTLNGTRHLLRELAGNPD